MSIVRLDTSSALSGWVCSDGRVTYRSVACVGERLVNTMYCTMGVGYTELPTSYIILSDLILHLHLL